MAALTSTTSTLNVNDLDDPTAPIEPTEPSQPEETRQALTAYEIHTVSSEGIISFENATFILKWTMSLKIQNAKLFLH